MTTDIKFDEKLAQSQGEASPRFEFHPNGRPIRKMTALVRPKRDDSPFEEIVFPATKMGGLLQGLVRSFLIKQEPRMGWAHKSACDESTLLEHPIESVGAHQWGVSFLLMTIHPVKEFQEEIPNFDLSAALQMALIHDLPELKVGDLTPRCGVSPEAKHQLEAEAMKSILSPFPEEVRKSCEQTYSSYEARESPESKVVKDCDRLDFMITGFVRERQGFSRYSEFYYNSRREGFATKFAGEMADLLIEVRESLVNRGLLYKKQ